MSMEYSPELATAYTKKREQMSQTDKPFFEALEQVGIEKKEIVDLGCGPGRHARIMKEKGASRVIGIDISEKMVELAKKETIDKDIHFLVADGQALPLKDKSADLVVSMYVLMYFADSKKVFGEIARVLRDEGHFVGIFNITEVEPGFEHLSNQEVPVRLGEGETSIVVKNLIKTPQEIEMAIKEAGFIIQAQQEVSDPMASIDDAFSDKMHIKKHPTLFTLQKIGNSTDKSSDILTS
jgi:ubiquinone/menaquinone biosynthesis C-methylase UbiE